MRHMMPEEILDALDLQPQYRTSSAVRDCILQQARQRADVYVGDVCHPTKKIGAVTPRVSTKPRIAVSSAEAELYAGMRGISETLEFVHLMRAFKSND